MPRADSAATTALRYAEIGEGLRRHAFLLWRCPMRTAYDSGGLWLTRTAANAALKASCLTAGGADP